MLARVRGALQGLIGARTTRGCSLSRHGTYERKTPSGTRVARWYCRESHTTFSLSPDCLAARLPGTLADLEAVAVTVEEARSVEAAADALRRDAVELPGTLRWVRRRVLLVRNVLVRVIGLIPERLSGCAAEMVTVRARLESENVLIELRALVSGQLRALPVRWASSRTGSGCGVANLPSNNRRGLIRLGSPRSVMVPGPRGPRRRTMT